MAETDDPVLLVLAALFAAVAGRPAAAGPGCCCRVATARTGSWSPSLERTWPANGELVDALARDHLVDFPGSYVVAWVASGAQIVRDGDRWTSLSR